MPFGIGCLSAIADQIASLPVVEMTPDQIADHLLMVRRRATARAHGQDSRSAPPPVYASSGSTFASQPTPQSGINPLAIGAAVFIATELAGSIDSGGGYVDSGNWSE